MEHPRISGVSEMTEEIIDDYGCPEPIRNYKLNSWISVKTALPEDDVKVLVDVGGYIGIQVAKYKYDTKIWSAQCTCHDRDYYLNVTHWMPLPKLPEEK